MTERERQIKACKKIGMTDEEIAEMLAEDAEINKMQTSKEIENDLTQEQKQNIKKTSRDRSGKYEKSEEALAREQQLRDEKADALKVLMQHVDVMQVTKEEKEFIYKVEGIKYRCTITRVRKQQEEE